MEHLEKVATLRDKLHDKKSGISNKVGVYCWWFKAEAAQKLISVLPLSEDEITRIQRQTIDIQEYWGLYFGISRDMLGRAKWHIIQHHSESTVKYGTLSTLRKTISALLGKHIAESEDIVNRFLDENCYWEWEYDDNYKQRETTELSSQDRCYPLNIQENKTVRKEVVDALTKLRCEYSAIQPLKKNEGKAIVLNRMYVGDYLSTNLGHEVINMFQADNGGHYLYLNATGNFASIHKNKIGYMLFVKYYKEDMMEVIGMATDLKEVEGCDQPLGKDYKAYNKIICDAQRNFIDNEDGGVKYGGASILDIFNDAEQQSIFITYKAGKVYTPVEGVSIFLHYGNDAQNVLNDNNKIIIALKSYNLPKTSLKSYIYPDNGNESEKEQYLADYNNVLDKLINNSDLWTTKGIQKVDVKNIDIQPEVSIFDICQIQNDENRFSYAFAYFMTQPQYKKLWQNFFKQYGVELGDNYTVAREESAKIEDKEWNHDERQSGGRIDLLIRDDKNIIVIENKIKADINSIEGDSEGEQLERYYNYISWSTQTSKPDEGKTPCFLILTPNYNRPHIKSKNMAELYRGITYGDLYTYLDGKDEVMNDSNFKAFFEAMHRHTHGNVNDYLYYEMLEKFVRRINEAPKSNK